MFQDNDEDVVYILLLRSASDPPCKAFLSLFGLK